MVNGIPVGVMEISIHVSLLCVISMERLCGVWFSLHETENDKRVGTVNRKASTVRELSTGLCDNENVNKIYFYLNIMSTR